MSAASATDGSTCSASRMLYPRMPVAAHTGYWKPFAISLLVTGSSTINGVRRIHP